MVKKLQALLNKASMEGVTVQDEDVGSEQDNPLMQAYKITALSKIEGVCDFIETLNDNGAKFIVFAHHRCMIDALEAYVLKKNIGHIRIDGRVTAEKRHESVTMF